jgi:hypothetical protein
MMVCCSSLTHTRARTHTHTHTHTQVNGMMLEGGDKIVYVGPFLNRGDRSPGKEMYTNVYLKNLHPSSATRS